MASRPARNSERFRQTLSRVYASRDALWFAGVPRVLGQAHFLRRGLCVEGRKRRSRRFSARHDISENEGPAVHISPRYRLVTPHASSISIGVSSRAVSVSCRVCTQPR